MLDDSKVDYLEGLVGRKSVSSQLILLLPVGSSPVDAERYIRMGAVRTLISIPLTHNELSQSCLDVLGAGQTQADVTAAQTVERERQNTVDAYSSRR